MSLSITLMVHQITISEFRLESNVRVFCQHFAENHAGTKKHTLIFLKARLIASVSLKIKHLPSVEETVHLIPLHISYINE